MRRILLASFALSALAFASCDKDSNPQPEDIFHGTWVKGPGHGDTVWFYKKNGVHIMKSNQSFNPGMNAYVENEYKYEFGQLRLIWKNATTLATLEQTVDSFNWLTQGQEFQVKGYQFYLFMSSTSTEFEFKKVL